MLEKLQRGRKWITTTTGSHCNSLCLDTCKAITASDVAKTTRKCNGVTKSSKHGLICSFSDKEIAIRYLHNAMCQYVFSIRPILFYNRNGTVIRNAKLSKVLGFARVCFCFWWVSPLNDVPKRSVLPFPPIKNFFFRHHAAIA